MRIHSACTHLARVAHSTSYSDVMSRGRPNLGPYVSFPDVLLRPGVRITPFVRPIRTRRRCNVFSTSATNTDVRKTYVRALIRSSSRRSWTSCRVGSGILFSNKIQQITFSSNLFLSQVVTFHNTDDHLMIILFQEYHSLS